MWMSIPKPEISGKHSIQLTKIEKNNNLRKTKRILNTSEGPVFRFNLPGRAVRTLALRLLRHCLLLGGGSTKLGARMKGVRGPFTRSRHSSYLKDHSKWWTYIHRIFGWHVYCYPTFWNYARVYIVIITYVTRGASSLEKRVRRRMAAFDHKTTFSLKTRNRPMNFTIFPNFGNPSCYFVSD